MPVDGHITFVGLRAVLVATEGAFAGWVMADKLLTMTLVSSALPRPRSFRFALLTLGFLACSGAYAALAQSSTSALASSQATPALPSGLSSISQLVVEGSQLALDSNGTLFRSDNHGKNWHQIRQQWDGKAVELLGIPPLTAAPASGQAPRSEADQELYAAVLLRSTTALHWVSVDRGKTWKPSTLDDVRRNDVRWSGQ
jgi:BNR-Asp box repeat